MRLIKGAYWDYELTHARLMNWPIPVWQHKSETDACFEQMTELFLKNTPRKPRQGGIKLALGSHNLRSIAHALAVAQSLDLPQAALEFQMLRGMADELKATLAERSHRVREYVPLGKMLPRAWRTSSAASSKIPPTNPGFAPVLPTKPTQPNYSRPQQNQPTRTKAGCRSRRRRTGFRQT